MISKCDHLKSRHVHRKQQLLLWLVGRSFDATTTVHRWDDDALSHEMQHTSPMERKRMRGSLSYYAVGRVLSYGKY